MADTERDLAAENDRHDDQCEAFFVEGPNVMHPCGCEDRQAARSAESVRRLHGPPLPPGMLAYLAELWMGGTCEECLEAERRGTGWPHGAQIDG